MKKQTSRTIPYRVYKKMFSDCLAYDYCNGKITVDFPQDYLESKMYIPTDWYKAEHYNYISKRFGTTSFGSEVSCTIYQRTDGGCKYYQVIVTVGNIFCNGYRKEKDFIRNFDTALQWGIETATAIIS